MNKNVLLQNRRRTFSIYFKYWGLHIGKMFVSLVSLLHFSSLVLWWPGDAGGPWADHQGSGYETIVLRPAEE